MTESPVSQMLPGSRTFVSPAEVFTLSIDLAPALLLATAAHQVVVLSCFTLSFLPSLLPHDRMQSLQEVYATSLTRFSSPMQ